MKIIKSIFVIIAVVCLNAVFVSCSDDSIDDEVYNTEVQNVDEDDHVDPERPKSN